MYARFLGVIVFTFLSLASSLFALSVTSARPRIYLNADRGLSLTELRAIAQSPAGIERKEDLSAVTADTGYYDMVNNAVKYLLYDDTIAAQRALTLLLACQFTRVVATYESVAMREAAVTYDLLWHYPLFTDSLKGVVRGALIVFASDCIDYLYNASRGAHIFHTRTSAALSALGTIALAVHQGRPQDENRLNSALYFWDSVYVPSRLYLDGAVGNGMSYGFYHSVRSDLLFQASLWSATDRNPSSDEVFLAKRESEYFIRNITPNGGWIKKDDISEFMFMSFAQARSVSDLLSALFNDSNAALQSRKLGELWGRRDYLPIKRSPDNSIGPLHGSYLYIYYLWGLRSEAAISVTNYRMDRTALFGQQSVGHFYTRGGWELDDFILFFKCGDYFEDHGHYDQGQFSLFMGAPLITKVGQWNNKTAGCASLMQVSSVERQRQPSFQSAANLAEYLSAKASRGLETGDIISCGYNDSIAWVESDLTKAYLSTECRTAKRSIITVRNRSILLVDQWIRATSSITPKSVFYTPNRPLVSGTFFQFHNTSLDGKLYKLDGKVVVPAEPELVFDSVFSEPFSGAQFIPLVGHGIVGDDTLSKASTVFGWRLTMREPTSSDTALWVTLLTPYKDSDPLYDSAMVIAHNVNSFIVAVGDDLLAFNRSNGLYSLDTALFIGAEKRLVGKDLYSAITVSPNPFVTNVSISLVSSEQGKDIAIYNAAGKVVKRLLPISVRSAGLTSFAWDGRDDKGRTIPRGVYFVSIRTISGREFIRRICLLQ